MTTTIICVALMSLLYFDLIISMNLILSSVIDDQNLPKSICRITNDVKSSKTDTHDILIGNLGGKIESKTVNDIIKCVSDDKAIVATDMSGIIQNIQLRKASVIILVLNQANKSFMLMQISKHYFSTVWHHMAKFICVVPSSATPGQRIQMLSAFTNSGSIDIAVVHVEESGDVIYETLTSDYKLNVQINPKSENLIFPDKLKDLRGFKLNVAVHSQPPRVYVDHTNVVTPMLYFLDAIEQFINVKLKLLILPDHSFLNQYWKQREVQLILNTFLIFKTKDPKLFTYETNGYCALVPVPSKIPLYHLMFIKPFDGLIWMLFGVSMFSSVAVWRMYQGRGAVDSHWQLAVGIFMMFIGQSAEFSRRNRFVLAVLLNIICLSVFLLNNLYEGAITSSMIEPGHENRLKTVQDLVASSHDVINDAFFANSVKNLTEFDKLKPRMNLRSTRIQQNFSTEIKSRRYVYIFRCDVAEAVIRSRFENGRPFSDYYYILHEKLFWNYVILDASYLNPFIGRFQYYMDLSFQAGLPHIWKVFAGQSSTQLQTYVNDEKILLELNDFHTVFVIFFLLCGLSVAVLLVEVFHHDFLENLINKNFRNRWQKMKFWKINNQKLKVRKIVVLPRHETN